MSPIQVVGIGLDGVAGLSSSIQQLIAQADVLAGSDRHLQYFPDHKAQRWPLQALETRLQAHLAKTDPGLVVVLTSGDPLFFGLGRQLLQTLPAEALTFHPHLSSVQLAFSRLKLPWQDAALVSAHGRSLDCLAHSLKMGADPIAVLTDHTHTPGAIAHFIQGLDLPTPYQIWVCENLGGLEERVHVFSLADIQNRDFSPLNVVVLQRLADPLPFDPLPLFGIADQHFLSFRDRPGLMTKREVRMLILGELALQPQQVFWDIGAGTGSVSIEVARLTPQSQVWAIEKTTVGSELIRQNARRFATPQIQVIQGKAPDVLIDLPAPDRVFIGGSSGRLKEILTLCCQRLSPEGRIVVALATLENLSEMTQWLTQQAHWQGQFQQVSLSRSSAVGALTRWMPLNPVTLVCLTRKNSGGC
ncbi:MAG: precorrin-6y C5,15-methyltransferase (decarboxylating) subunit CbiE [Leptolyngbya sp. SIO1D8]|nr:precorrin-6y C5,15-methyltransferase (decarboxylating) subunit CbiE [Leptolyngbya sp. SIO1D8]